MPDIKTERFQRIAVEEGYIIPEIAALERLAPASPAWQTLLAALLDLGAGRIRTMDEHGIATQLCVVSGNSLQDIDPVEGNALAALANDRLAEAARTYPGRIAGLAAFAPLDPARAAGEIERAVKKLGFKGAVIKSHSGGQYLDDRKFWPIFETLQALDVPLYIHPRNPSPGMSKPLDVFGFKVGWSWAVETATHVVRLIGNGVFDQFPRLRIVIGHMGEGLPFLLDRIDNRYDWEHAMAGIAPKLKRKPSDYIRDNLVVTTSGMNYAPPLLMTIQMLGIDNVLFAADYPFEKLGDCVKAIDDLALSDRDKEKIYCLNAKRVFAL